MTGLFSNETLEFFCVHQTTNEIKQFQKWALKEISKKIKLTQRKESRRFLQFVAAKVNQNLNAIFDGTGDEGDSNFFVTFYTRLYKLCDNQQQDDEEMHKIAAKRKQILKQIKQRDEKRREFLNSVMGNAKIANFVKWFEQSNQKEAVEFNIIVDAFIEELTRVILEKGVDLILFPIKNNFIKSTIQEEMR